MTEGQSSLGTPGSSSLTADGGGGGGGGLKSLENKFLKKPFPWAASQSIETSGRDEKELLTTPSKANVRVPFAVTATLIPENLFLRLGTGLNYCKETAES